MGVVSRTFDLHYILFLRRRSNFGRTVEEPRMVELELIHGGGDGDVGAAW